ncbi:hypothetical protein HDU76_012133, partial [Blyttiomyces sp. JEL0837]
MTTSQSLFTEDPDIAAFESGFINSIEQRDPLFLKVTSVIPSWFHGNLYRCAPSEYSFVTKNGKHVEIDHWFDGLTQIHKFTVYPDGTVSYNSRKTAQDLGDNYEQAGVGFAQRDPCKTVFSRIATTFSAIVPVPRLFSSNSQTPSATSANIGVTISPDFPLSNPLRPAAATGLGPKTLVVKTDAAALQELDPTTLEPVRLFSYHSVNKKFKGRISAAHGQYDANTGEYFNFTMDFGASGATFHAIKVSHENPDGDLIVKLNNVVGSYMHSFACTDRYLVYPFFPFNHVGTGLSIIWHGNILDSLKWNPDNYTLLVVIDRKQNKHVATYRTTASFGFHVINAWEENDDIIFDLPSDNNPSIVSDLYLQKLRSGNGITWPKLRRYRLPNISSNTVSSQFDLITIVNPVVNPAAKNLPDAS